MCLLNQAASCPKGFDNVQVTFSSSGIETLMSSCNLIQTGLLAITINKLIALSFTIKLTSL